MDEVTDAPVDGSSFQRHFCHPYESAEHFSISRITSVLDPSIGYYKSTARRITFPFLKPKNPITPTLNEEFSPVYNILCNYEDLLYCRRYPQDETIRLMYCAHVLNHSLLSRKLILKNNEIENARGCSDALRDQGFHRARSLVLVPTKESARRVVHTILRLMPKGSTVSHRRRFEQDFGPQPGETDDEKRKGKKPADFEEWFACNTNDHFRIGIAFAKKTVKLYSAFSQSDVIIASPLGIQTIIDDEQEKEADLQYITASTELLVVDQAEMLLMQNWANVQKIVAMLNKRPKKAAFASAGRIRLSYLAGFGRRYRQTLIFSAVAAPLITLLTGECENFQGINFIPPSPRYFGMYPTFLPDTARIPGLKATKAISSLPLKRACLDAEVSKSSVAAPTGEIKLSLLAFAVVGQVEQMRMHPAIDMISDEDNGDDDYEVSIAGCESVAVTKSIEPEQFTVTSSGLNVLGDIVFKHKYKPKSDLSYLAERAVPLARMNAFKQRVLPRLRRGQDPRVLIYVPDFYDLEELRTVLSSESLDFCCVHEYQDDNEAERFRTLFADGRIRILVLSERYYFFRRRKIRGAQTFIFYGPPTFPWFVKELLDTGHSTAVPTDSDLVQLSFLYYPPYEAHTIATITGKIEL